MMRVSTVYYSETSHDEQTVNSLTQYEWLFVWIHSHLNLYVIGTLAVLYDLAVCFQEMEHIRSEMAALRTQTNMAAARAQSQSVPRGLNQLLADRDARRDRQRDPAAITNPNRVSKLTKFFGDEPPLLRLFLKKLGYEVSQRLK